MKIIFAGTPDFSVKSLKNILNSNHEIVAVYTQPDRPSGRGCKLNISSVKKTSLIYNIPVYQPSNFKEKETIKILKQHNADVMVVVAYGIILPKEILKIPLYGCLNIHASLLPNWRGASPIQRSIENGDKETGITIMKMDEGLDTGDILYKKNTLINKEDTSQSLHDSLSNIGSNLIIKILDNIKYYLNNAKKQQNEKATYAHKIKKSEAEIDWNLSSDTLKNKVNAFNPWPVTFSKLDNNYLRIWKVESIKDNKYKNYKAGKILSIDKIGIEVKTGEGILKILQLQPRGKKIMSAYDFAQSRQLLDKTFT